MYKKLLSITILLCIGITVIGQRVEQNIDFDWYFHLGDINNG